MYLPEKEIMTDRPSNLPTDRKTHMSNIACKIFAEAFFYYQSRDKIHNNVTNIHKSQHNINPFTITM